MNDIVVPFQHLRRIVHLADLHIRLFKRHEEYRECFETFFRQLNHSDLTDTVILVAGDIVHSKTDLSPEMVQLASEFLARCASLAPTLVIAGNHDCNLANASRLDALSPIVANIQNPNLHYLKYSGIYACADVDFHVCSIIGEQTDWSLAPHLDGRTKIALFHGPVHNAKTDIGYTITNRHVMIETFDGFHMVLMGDIHRHQILQHKEAYKPIIVYSSSFIQQNHGETRAGHGWCDWDVPSMTFEFVELPNTYGYYTLLVENGVVPDWSDMPQNVHLRIFAGSLTQAEIKELVTTIRAQRNVRELSVSSFDGGRQITAPGPAGVVLDIADVNVQNKFIAEYLFEVMPSIAVETVERVLELNKLKNADIVADDLARKLVWRPRSLKYSNLFTYGDANFIKFDSLHGVLGIFAPNATGKTSIAEAICFALYDRTPRTQKASNIMNTRTKKCSCEFRFEIDGVEYVIERKGARNTKGEVKIDVDFYKIEAGKKISLNGEDRRYTNQIIRNYVGDFEDFLLTTFSSSSQQGLFVDRGQSDRKDLLSQFMGLTIFDKLHTLANDESKEIAGALKRFKNDDFTQELATAQNGIASQRLAQETAQVELDIVNQRLNQLTMETQALYERKIPMKPIGDLYTLEYARGKLIEESCAESKKLEANTAQLEDFHNKMASAEAKVLEMTSVETLFRQWSELNIEIQRIKHLNQQVGVELKAQNLRLHDLDKHKYDPNCIFCVQNGQTSIQAKEKVSQRINELTQQEAEHVFRIADLENLKSAIPSDIEDQHKRLVAARSWIEKTRTIIAQTETINERILAKSAEFREKIRQADADIAEYHAMQDMREANIKLIDQIRELDTEKNSYKKQFNELTAAVQKAIATIAVLQEREKDMNDKIREAEELEAKYDAYDAYLTAVNRDGLPYKLIVEMLPKLEVAVNDLLNQMVEFTLVFEADGKNIHMKIRYNDEQCWALELASGMEKFISSLAIRVALTGVSSLPKSNFLIIDEGLGTLDRDNLASISMLFNMLRTKFDFIMLISHVDEVRDVADSLVEIRRSADGFSQVQIQ
jgi:DNA repair exonuclease SbcCD ATPase subunit